VAEGLCRHCARGAEIRVHFSAQSLIARATAELATATKAIGLAAVRGGGLRSEQPRHVAFIALANANVALNLAAEALNGDTLALDGASLTIAGLVRLKAELATALNNIEP